MEGRILFREHTWSSSLRCRNSCAAMYGLSVVRIFQIGCGRKQRKRKRRRTAWHTLDNRRYSPYIAKWGNHARAYLSIDLIKH